MFRRGVGMGLVAVVLGLAPAFARAQDVAVEPTEAAAAEPADTMARAREYFSQGVELTRQDRWGEALVYFRRSLALVERPNTLFNIAGILVRLGRGREAVEHYERYLRVAAATDPDREAALAALESARDALARLRISVHPEGAQVRVDGLRIDGDGSDHDLLLDPGEHVIDLSAPGHHREVFRVSLLPGASGERSIDLVPAGVEGPGGGPTDGSAAIPDGTDGGPNDGAAMVSTSSFDETPIHVLLVVGLATAAVGAGALTWGLADRAQVEGAGPGRSWDELADAYDRTQLLTPLGVAALVLGAGVAGVGAGWLAGLGLSATVGPTEARLEARGDF